MLYRSGRDSGSWNFTLRNAIPQHNQAPKSSWNYLFHPWPPWPTGSSFLSQIPWCWAQQPIVLEQTYWQHQQEVYAGPGFLRHNLGTSPCDVKTRCCNTFVQSIAEYASCVLSPSTKKGIDKVESIQNRAARYVMHERLLQKKQYYYHAQHTWLGLSRTM